MKKLLAGSGIVAGVLALGLMLGYWHFSSLVPAGVDPGREERAPDAVARAPAIAPGAGPADGVSEASTPPEPGQAPAAEGGSEAETASITLLRVEPDGSALLAGRADPSGEVVIRSGDSVLAREDVSPGGNFVVTLDEPLPVGDHELTLEAVGRDGARRISPEVAVVSVPAPDRPQDLLVAVGSPQAPTRLIDVPAGSSEPAPSATALAPLRGSTDEAERVPPAAAAPDATADGDLAIAAVEIENERIFVAGSSRPGATIRIYLDDEFIAQADEEGEQFIAEAIGDVAVGSHTVRADEIGSDGSVVARVEVPFVRPEGSRMAALAPGFGGGGAPVEEPAPASPTDPEIREPASAGIAAPSAAGSQDEDELPALAAAPAASATQAALEPVDGRVIIRRGDTLWAISRETYGQGRRYTTIYLANGDQIRDPDLIYPGQIFRMPAEAEEEASAAN